MSEWLPIESAPKDGTSILVWFDSAIDPEPMIVRYRNYPLADHEFSWVDSDGNGALANRCVKFWCPLPTPPQSKKGDPL